MNFDGEVLDAKNRLIQIVEKYKTPEEICAHLNYENKEDLIILWLLSSGCFINGTFSGISNNIKSTYPENIEQIPFLYIVEEKNDCVFYFKFSTLNLKRIVDKIVYKSFDIKTIKDSFIFEDRDINSLEDFLNTKHKIKLITANFIDGIFFHFEVIYYEKYKDFDVKEKTLLI